MARGRSRLTKAIWISAATLAVGLLAIWPHPADAAPGDLDPSFGDSGIVRTHIGSSEGISGGAAMARDTSGRLVVAGNHQDWAPGGGLEYGIVLARYLPDGDLDPSFGTGGIATVPSTAAGTTQISALAMSLDSAGRIVVTGQAFDPPATGPASSLDYDAMVFRLLPSGDLDSSFGGGDGMVVTDFSGDSFDSASAVAVDDNDRILITSITGAGGSFDDLGLLLARYTSSGALDPTFGDGDGYLTELPPMSSEKGFFLPKALAIDDSGRILVAGGGFAAVRFLASGVLDMSFGEGDGWVSHRVGTFDEATAIAIDPTGNILAGGRHGYHYLDEESLLREEYDLAAVRYSESGELDTTFGDGESMAVAHDEGLVAATGLALDGNGRIVVGGLREPLLGFTVARFLPSGRISGSFGGGDGIVNPDLGSEAFGAGMVVDDDGHVIQAGGLFTGDEFTSSWDLALVRYEGGPAVDVYHALSVEVDGEGEGTVTGLGIDCGAECSTTYDEGTVVTLKAKPAGESAPTPSEFAGWSGDCTGTDMCEVTMDDAKNVTATFEPLPDVERTLTIVVTGPGTVIGDGILCGATGTDCSEVYPDDAEVTLTPLPEPDAVFWGWGAPECLGIDPCMVTMDVNRTIDAFFEAVSEEPAPPETSPPTTLPPPSLAPPAVVTQPPSSGKHPKAKRCKKGFRKRKVRGKAKCVKVKRAAHRRSQRSR